MNNKSSYNTLQKLTITIFILAIIMIVIASFLPSSESNNNLNQYNDINIAADPNSPALQLSASLIEGNTFLITANAKLPEFTVLQRMSCVVMSTDTNEVLFSDSTKSLSQEWNVASNAAEVKVIVTVYPFDASPVKKEAIVKNIASVPTSPKYQIEEMGLFKWPAEPQFRVLAHDNFLVNSGAEQIGGYTHNNGLIRQKHYVQITGRSHYGFDITLPENTPIAASCEGIVELISKSSSDGTDTSDYGNYMVLRHFNTPFGEEVYSYYAHLNEFKVSHGDFVSQGEIIGLSGNTGGSRIPHCHFEIRIGANSNNYAVNPLELLPSRDLDSLPELTLREGIPASSAVLYASMRTSDWGFDVKVKSKNDIILDDGQVLPRGTEVSLVKRTNSGVTVSYNGSQYTLGLKDFLYTY